MRKKLEADLKDLANKILDLKEPDATVLKQQARDLYEKLTILAFTEENLAAFSENNTSKNQPEETTSDLNSEETKKKERVIELPSIPSPQQSETKVEEKDEYLPDGTEYNDSEAITEPNTEKIKDIVAQMPPETEKLDFMVNSIISKEHTAPIVKESVKEPKKEEEKRDFRDIGVDYDNLPNFEPVRKQQESNRPKSLNDRLKKGFNIGLNERLAFIRHLFEGKTADYNRVISQLNTFDSVDEAKRFIQLVVKPDYKNWQGKEEFENKFMELVENKFRH